MRVAFLGRGTKLGESVAPQLLRELGVTSVVLMRMKGFARDVAKVARCEVLRFLPAYIELGKEADLAAVDQVVTHARPDLVVCLSPTECDLKIMQAFVGHGIKGAIGVITKGRVVTWNDARTYNGYRCTAL